MPIRERTPVNATPDGAGGVSIPSGFVEVISAAANADEAITRPSVAIAANELMLTAGASRVVKTFDLGTGIIKATAGGIAAIATADVDYATPGLVSGSFTYQAITTTATLSANGYINSVKMTAATAIYTVMLPTAAGISGKRFILTLSSSSLYDVTIDANGSELINGNLSLILSAGDSMQIISDGTGWLIQ